VIYTVTVVH